MRVVHNSPSMASPASLAFPFPLSCLFFPPPSNPFPTPPPPFPTPPFPSLSCPSLVTLPPTLLPYSFSFSLSPPPLLPTIPLPYPIVFFCNCRHLSLNLPLFLLFCNCFNVSSSRNITQSPHFLLKSINEM
jgi:hypothetical protein